MMVDDPSTILSAVYVKGIVNVRLRFGEPQRIEHASDELTRYDFAPGQRFGVLWWARLSVRRQIEGVAIAESLHIGESGYRLPCVDRAVQVHAFLNCRCVGKDRGVAGGR